MKTLRFLPFLLLAVCLGFVLTSCSLKKDESAAVVKPHWPPDTLMLAIVGNGMIRLSSQCTAGAMREGSGFSATYRLMSSIRDPHWPQDTTAVSAVQAILERVPVGGSYTSCLMLKWIPDTASTAAVQPLK